MSDKFTIVAGDEVTKYSAPKFAVGDRVTINNGTRVYTVESIDGSLCKLKDDGTVNTHHLHPAAPRMNTECLGWVERKRRCHPHGGFVVLAEKPNSTKYGGTEFATWRMDLEGNCFWGHYFMENYAKAYHDFIMR